MNGYLLYRERFICYKEGGGGGGGLGALRPASPPASRDGCVSPTWCSFRPPAPLQALDPRAGRAAGACLHELPAAPEGHGCAHDMWQGRPGEGWQGWQGLLPAPHACFFAAEPSTRALCPSPPGSNADPKIPTQPNPTRCAELKLAARNMSVASLHGELTKQQRQATLNAFRRGAPACLLQAGALMRGNLTCCRCCCCRVETAAAATCQPPCLAPTPATAHALTRRAQATTALWWCLTWRRAAWTSRSERCAALRCCAASPPPCGGGTHQAQCSMLSAQCSLHSHSFHPPPQQQVRCRVPSGAAHGCGALCAPRRTHRQVRCGRCGRCGRRTRGAVHGMRARTAVWRRALCSGACAFSAPTSTPLNLPAVCLGCCRAGRHGTVVSLVAGGERHVVERLGRRLGVKISEVEVAFGEAVERAEKAKQEGGAGASSGGELAAAAASGGGDPAAAPRQQASAGAPPQRAARTSPRAQRRQRNADSADSA